jgi:hypothetical protein
MAEKEKVILTQDELCFHGDPNMVFHPLAPKGVKILLEHCHKTGDVSGVECPFCGQGKIKFTDIHPWEHWGSGYSLFCASSAFRYACEHCGIKFQTIMWYWEIRDWKKTKEE